MSELLWITEGIARAIHDEQIAQHGGSFGVRDENFLSTSLARPRHLHAYEQP